MKDELKGYHLAKGTIQFPTNKPLPAALIKKMVELRVAQAKTRKSRRSRQPSGNHSMTASPTIFAAMGHPTVKPKNGPKSRVAAMPVT